MVTVNDMLKRWQRVNVETAAGESVTQTARELVDYNLEQMMEGKRKDGQDISPTYLEDPYFKSRESAQRYSDWKDDITPNSKRKKGVPNLFINGRFHRSITAYVESRSIIFRSTSPDAGGIESKFKEIYGLNSEMRVLYIGKYLRPELLKVIKEKIKR